MLTLLPNPCAAPDCSERIVYGGKGRRPRYCSTRCQQAAKVARRRVDRALARAALIPRPHVHAADDVVARAVAGRRARYAAAMRARRIAASDSDVFLQDLNEVRAADGLPRLTLRERYIGGRGEIPPTGYVFDDDTRPRVSRDRDLAARWIADVHPEALHDFPPAL
ncbi:CGNR zinc finger domain-containing protein [Blastococcus sp. SYSU D00922]